MEIVGLGLYDSIKLLANAIGILTAKAEGLLVEQRIIKAIPKIILGAN